MAMPQGDPIMNREEELEKIREQKGRLAEEDRLKYIQ